MNLIRHVIFISSLALVISQALKATPDSLRYELYINYGCENQIKKIIDFTIEDRNHDIIAEFVSDSTGICKLPNDTNYVFYLRIPLLWWLMKIDLDKDIEFKTDTITIPPIYLAPIERPDSIFIIGPTYYVYYNCGQLCNKTQKSYRYNGQLWQKGHFKRGNLRSLKVFYSNGRLESKSKKRLLNGCDVLYNESSILIRRLNYFLFLSYYKIYDERQNKYIKNLSFGRYK
jgi:hypothetical protein